MPDESVALLITYNWHLVALSIMIAVIGSYTAFDLAGRVTAMQYHPMGLGWLAGCAAAMGIGIWSMHFIAMLAFSLPIPITYHVPTVLASMLPVILASGAALFVVTQRQMGALRWFIGGMFMGLGIVLPHYIGMAAMRMQAVTHYDPWLTALSLAIAVAGSFVALWVAFRPREESPAEWSWRKGGGSLIMGSSVGGMHYTAMAAARFLPSPSSEAPLESVIGTSALGGVAIGIATLLVLGITLLTSLMDERFTTALRQSEDRFRSLYQTGQALVSNLELESLLQNIADTARDLLDARLCVLLVPGEGGDKYDHFKVSGPIYRQEWLSEGMEIFGIPHQQGAVLRMDDITKHPKWIASADHGTLAKAFLGVPLRIKDRLLGSLIVCRGTEDPSFSGQNEELLLAFANQAAIALENARLYGEQKQAVIRLQELSLELNKARETQLLTEERNRIAQDLHDKAAQDLFSIGLKANWCLDRIGPDSEIYQAIAIIKRLAGESTVHMRDAIYRLSASGDGGGHLGGHLIDSLRRLAHEFKDASGIDADVVAGGALPALPGAIEEALVSVAREALANVAKHSRARVAVVSLQGSREDVMLTVQDDGIGLPSPLLDSYPDSVTRFGVKGMRRRIEELGGQFHLQNGDESGLIVTATVPIGKGSDEKASDQSASPPDRR